MSPRQSLEIHVTFVPDGKLLAAVSEAECDGARIIISLPFLFCFFLLTKHGIYSINIFTYYVIAINGYMCRAFCLNKDIGMMHTCSILSMCFCAHFPRSCFTCLYLVGLCIGKLTKPEDSQ